MNLDTLYTSLLHEIHRKIDGSTILILGAGGDTGSNIAQEILEVGSPLSLTLLDVNYTRMEELGHILAGINDMVDINYIVSDAIHYVKTTKSHYDYVFNCAVVPWAAQEHDESIHHLMRVNCLLPYLISENGLGLHIYTPVCTCAYDVPHGSYAVAECIMAEANLITHHCTDMHQVYPEIALISMFTTPSGTVLYQDGDRYAQRPLMRACYPNKMIDLLNYKTCSKWRYMREIVNMDMYRPEESHEA